jgi:hypothetical protein
VTAEELRQQAQRARERLAKEPTCRVDFCFAPAAEGSEFCARCDWKVGVNAQVGVVALEEWLGARE